MKLIFVLLIVVSPQFIFAGTKFSDTTFYYTIELTPQKDRTDLDIDLKFKVNSDTAISVESPRDFYGTPSLYKYLLSIKGDDGTIVNTTDEPDERIVIPGANRQVHIRYTLSYDPKKLEGYSYAPVIAPNYFHIAACQWMLIINSIKTNHHYQIKIINPPSGWKLYSSVSADPFNVTLDGSFSDVFNKYWGGGSQYHQIFYIEGKPVDLFFVTKIKIPKEKISKAVFRIVSSQRSLFRDFDFPHYVVTILPREDNVAGLNITNMFMCFVEEGATQKQLLQLLSHEMFHVWLGNKIHIATKEDDKIFKYHWFTEGFTDFIANRILLDNKMITESEFAESMNRYIVNIADDPFKDYSYSDLVKLSDSGKYNTAATKLQYYRGALMALGVDCQLKQKSSNLTVEGFVRELYDSSMSTSGITPDYLFAFSERRGINLKQIFEEDIAQGKPIRLFDKALGSRYHLVTDTIPSFELGFSLRETDKTKMISGLIPGSAADKAGIKDGQQFVTIGNYNRFGNNWRYDKPTIVTIKENGKEKKIKYFPYGKNIVIQQYRIKYKK